MLSWALRHRLGLTVSGAGFVGADVGLVLLQVPDDVALGIPDGQRVRPGDEAARGVLEILPVIEVQLARRARLAALVASDAGLGCVADDC